MNVKNEKQTEDGDELQKARDLYKKIKRITERGRDVRVKRKKDGKLYVYEEKLQLAE